MRALVVFESMFGNTERIARAVADGLATELDVEVIEVGSAPTAVPEDVRLLVLGGPTQAFGMSHKSTRQAAVKETSEPLVSIGIGIREWLETLPPNPDVWAATFDTRFKKSRGLTGSAAHGAQRRLRRKGYGITVPAESFFVDKTTGPLLEGEMERARAWGASIAGQFPRARAAA